MNQRINQKKFRKTQHREKNDGNYGREVERHEG